MRFRSANLDLGVGNKLVRRQRQISRCRAAPDTSRGVVDRAVARAEPTAIFALMCERDTAEMRANADDHKPLVMALLHARRVWLWIGQARYIDLLRLLDFLLRAMEDEDRLRAPKHLDDLTIGYGSKVDVNRCTGRDGRCVRIHLRDQRNKNRRSAHRAHGA